MTLLLSILVACHRSLNLDEPDTIGIEDVADTALDTGSCVPETCNGVDDDCDGQIDEDAADAPTWYLDSDADGWGTDADVVTACVAPDGYVGTSDDCDDRDPRIHPGGEEVCGGGDEDCDGEVDEAGATGESVYYPDADGDTWGASAPAESACRAPPGFVTDDTDCDDAAAGVHPDAIEQCNGIDDDCDGLVDEDVVVPSWHLDADGDGYGDPTASSDACVAPAGWVADDTDCDDADPAIHPGAPDPRDDAIDEDCDGADACGTIVPYDGTVVFSGAAAAADMAAFCGTYNAVTGRLIVERTDLVDLTALGCVCQAQDDVFIESNDFLTSLDGLQNLDTIGDMLYVYSNDALVDLSALSGLVSVGTVSIDRNDALADLTGIDVTSIDADLSIFDDPSLTSLGGLSSLTSVGGALRVEYDDSLMDLAGLDGVTRVGGAVSIGYDASLTSLHGLESLTEVGGLLWIDSNDALLDLSALGGLVSVESVEVEGNRVLADLDGLDGFSSLDGDLDISDDASLTSLGALENLTSIGGTLTIYSNQGLTDLTGLDNVTSVGDDVRLDYDLHLASLHGLESIDHVGRYLSVMDCRDLPSLDGLDALTSLWGLRLDGNDDLTDLTALLPITELPGDLLIYTNSDLVDLTGLDNITEVGGNVLLYGSYGPGDLESLSGLGSLTTIGGYLGIELNDNLTDLSGLESLTEVGSGVAISGNDALLSCDGLEGLRTVGEDLVVQNNTALTDVSALETVDTVAVDLTITDNPTLATSDAEALRDAIGSIGGSVTISGNGP